jgi:hypothetical protein
MNRTLFIVICRRLDDGYMMAGMKIEQPAPAGCAYCCLETVSVAAQEIARLKVRPRNIR